MRVVKQEERGRKEKKGMKGGGREEGKDGRMGGRGEVGACSLEKGGQTRRQVSVIFSCPFCPSLSSFSVFVLHPLFAGFWPVHLLYCRDQGASPF